MTTDEYSNNYIGMFLSVYKVIVFRCRESTLYVSTNYGKNFDTKDLTYGGKSVICDFIYQSTVDHKLVFFGWF